MLSADGNYCISFNGEIYNTSFLEQLLMPYSICYHSTSDTERLLYSLVYLGVEKTLSVTDGMFAFAFYDALQNSLVLARDRVGIKPLYVGSCSDGIVYSSQYDHIINHNYFINEPMQHSAIASYLFLGYMCEGSGIIGNTQMLPHGHYLNVKNNQAEMRRYYTYGVEAGKRKKANIEELLAGSVKSQLVSDVPTGSFMSGGVDSTLVTYFAGKAQQLSSFTIGLNDAQLNEAEEAEQFASYFRTEHFTKYISPGELLPLLKENALAFQEPFADYSSLPMLVLSAFAKQKITVALSGDGGDELFWGYKRNATALANIWLYNNKFFGKKFSLVMQKLLQPSTTDISRHWGQKSFLDYYYFHLIYYRCAAMAFREYAFAEPSVFIFLEECKTLEQEGNNHVGKMMALLRKNGNRYTPSAHFAKGRPQRHAPQS